MDDDAVFEYFKWLAETGRIVKCDDFYIVAHDEQEFQRIIRQNPKETTP